MAGYHSNHGHKQESLLFDKTQESHFLDWGGWQRESGGQTRVRRLAVCEISAACVYMSFFFLCDWMKIR